MKKYDAGVKKGMSKTRRELLEKFDTLIETRSIRKEDLVDITQYKEPRPKSVSSKLSYFTDAISTLFRDEPSKHEKNDYELGIDVGITNERARVATLFKEWFDIFKTIDNYTYQKKIRPAIEGNREDLDWDFVLPNTKDPPHERLLPGKYRR
ncbi:MAG: hypothetical protein WC717_06375 [Candidatus Micrarchaeia archaeon]|jgi:hypothetical protein